MQGRSTLREYLESFILSVIVVLFVRSFLVEAVQIPTGSMEDTLLPGDHLFINKFTFRSFSGEQPLKMLPYTEVRRKDVVVFRFFDQPGEPRYYVKRVIGLPGETVEIRSKQVFIDGRPLDEPYAVFKEPSRKDLRPRDFMGPTKLPVEHFFVLGDNRDSSYDSRFWGPLSRELIIGRPLFIWWSFDWDGSSATEREGADGRRWLITRFFRDTRWSRTGKTVH